MKNPSRFWILFGAFAGVLFALQLSLPDDLSERPETSFETAPRGHAALFALLSGFDATPGRWTSGLSMPEVSQPVWFIAPNGVCSSVAAAEVAAGSFGVSVLPWIEAGGTALVWLSHPPVEPPGSSAPRDRPPDPAAPEDTQTIAWRRPEAADAARPTSIGSSQSTRPGAEAKAEADPESDATSPPEGEVASDAAEVRARWREAIDARRRAVREGRAMACPAVAGFALPGRRLAGLEGGAIPIDADETPMAFAIGRAPASDAAFDYEGVRSLPGPTLAFFEGAEPGWRPLWLEADDRLPFVLERSVGEGRLVVIADARVVTNGRLASLDAAPFVFDQVRDYGTPWIDEHRHGVVPESGAVRYLARSPAAAVGMALLVCVGVGVWRGRGWPTREPLEPEPDAPTLATFVASVARLYAGTQDHARVFERARGVALERIRRRLGLPPGASVERVIESLAARAERDRRPAPEGLRDLLVRDPQIEDAATLVRAAARLDRVVSEVADRTNEARDPAHSRQEGWA